MLISTNIDDICSQASDRLVLSRRSSKMHLNKGDRFASYTDFCAALKLFEKEVVANFYKATTIKLHVSVSVSSEVAEKFKYRRLYFKCKFSGNYSTTAQRRQNTQTFKQGCTARFALSFHQNNGMNALVVTTMDAIHNHDRDEELFRRMPNQRHGAIKEAHQFLERVANVKPDAKLLQFEVSKNNPSMYPVKRKDIYNFNAKNKQSVGINDLDKVVNELRKIDGATVKIVHNDAMQLQGIFFQDSRMKKYFSVYPEILMFDATYNLNDRQMALVILLVVDGNGESQIAGFFIVITENMEIMTEMFNQFKQENDNWDKIEVVMTDKAMVNLNTVRTEFPNAVHHLCIFHIAQIFLREITTIKRNITQGQRNECLQILNNMIYAKSETDYDRLYEELMDLQCEGKISNGNNKKCAGECVLL